MVDYESVTKKIAANLRNLISARCTTQMEVAELLGTSQSAVSKWARAQVMPELKSIVGLADLFGVTVSEIVGDAKSEEFENSTYRISDETWGRKPAIDKEELEAMELLHKRGIIDDAKFYGYITEKLKEIAE